MCAVKQKNIKRMTIIYFAVAAFLAAIAISFAAYTSLSSVKRVVTVKGTEQLFTSDVLLEYETDTELQTRVISFAENSQESSFTVDVMNYIQGDTTKVDALGITYTFYVDLIDSSGNSVTSSDILSQFSVSKNDGEQKTLASKPYYITGSLSGGEAHKDSYTFIVARENLSAYRLKITAVPDGNIYSPIGRIIAFSTETTSSNWTGNFLEAEKAAINNSEELGLFNYQIAGQVEETCVLSWDSSKVEIDPWFISDMKEKNLTDGTITKSGNRESIILKLGVAGTPEQYLITFYRTYAAQDLNETWDEIANTDTGYVVFKNSVTAN